jgi:hypothetical protein
VWESRPAGFALCRCWWPADDQFRILPRSRLPEGCARPCGRAQGLRRSRDFVVDHFRLLNPATGSPFSGIHIRDRHGARARLQRRRRDAFVADGIVHPGVGSGRPGVILALPINGISATFYNTVTFSMMAFSFRVTMPIVIQALAFAAVMGLIGGWLPARQAMRMSVVDALRSL